MKSFPRSVLVAAAVFLVVSSFATLTGGEEGPALFRSKEPSTGSVVTLARLDVPQAGNLSPDIAYWTTVHFESGGEPDIRKACFRFSGGSQTCVDVPAKDVVYGVSHPYFRVSIHIPAGTKRIDCYAEYMRDGKTHRTNTVTYRVIIMKPEE